MINMKNIHKKMLILGYPGITGDQGLKGEEGQPGKSGLPGLPVKFKYLLIAGHTICLINQLFLNWYIINY